MTHKYGCEKHRNGKIDVSCGKNKGETLSEGKAAQFYWLGFPQELKEWAEERYPRADVWYTERNGDCIGMLVPKGTPVSMFPTLAMDYVVHKWIDPDTETRKV